MEINNRTLQQVTGYSHPQIKRWSVAFLDPDPSAGQHSGKTRFYSFDEATKIYLGGILVNRFKLNLKETGQILVDIDSWLKTKGWIFSNLVKFKQDTITKEYDAVFYFDKFGWIELIFSISRGERGYMYDVKEVISRESIKDPENERKSIFSEKYRLHYFGDNSSAVPEEEIGTFGLSNLITAFASRVCININNKI